VWVWGHFEGERVDASIPLLKGCLNVRELSSHCYYLEEHMKTRSCGIHPYRSAVVTAAKVPTHLMFTVVLPKCSRLSDI
jgi:hypothetical protein